MTMILPEGYRVMECYGCSTATEYAPEWHSELVESEDIGRVLLCESCEGDVYLLLEQGDTFSANALREAKQIHGALIKEGILVSFEQIYSGVRRRHVKVEA